MLDGVVDYVIYDKNNGDIIRVGQCSKRIWAQQKDRVFTSNDICEGKGDNKNHKVINGKVVPRKLEKS